jgi:hypothetical protein
MREERQSRDLLYEPPHSATIVPVHYSEAPLLQLPPQSLAEMEEAALQLQATCVNTVILWQKEMVMFGVAYCVMMAEATVSIEHF